LTAFFIIKLPTKIKTDPVDQDGRLLSSGEKKMATKNQKDVAIAVRPVFPPSEIPEADSIADSSEDEQSCQAQAARLTYRQRAYTAKYRRTGLTLKYMPSRP
jgi:hypothetical protein